MSKILDHLLDLMDENLTGCEDSRLSVTRDEWDDLKEDSVSAWCSEECYGICGELFPVKDFVSHISCSNVKNNLYSFRSRYNYPPLKKMDESQMEKLFEEWMDHDRSNYCSPFGCGSDQDWYYEFIDFDGQRYMFTYNYMGS